MYNEVVDERGVNLHRDFSSFFLLHKNYNREKQTMEVDRQMGYDRVNKLSYIVALDPATSF